MTWRALLRPSVLILAPVVLSGAVWLAPLGDHIRRGFTDKAHLTLGGLVFLAAWYGLIVIGAEAGFVLGRGYAPFEVYERIPDDSYYRYFSIVALIGTVYTYALVAVQHPGLLATALSHAQLNLVRGVIPYSAGVPTLRYATAVAGGIALYRIGTTRRLAPIGVLNLMALVLAAAIASRLLIVLCLVIVIGLVVRSRPYARITIRPIILGAGLFFVVLTPLNYYRNAHYYNTEYRISNPFVMNVYEMTAYLGAPFQAAVGVSSNSDAPTPTTSESARAALVYATPTYIHVRQDTVDAASTAYRAYVDVDPALTTNSVLAGLFSSMGWWAFLFMTGIAFVGGAVMGHASGYRSLAGLVVIIVGYAFAETWRVYLFNAGLIQFIVLVILLAPAVLRRRDAVLRRHVEGSEPTPA